MKKTSIIMKLSNKAIGETVEIIEKWLAELETERIDVLRLSLSLEEILLNWQDRFGSDVEFELLKSSRMGQPYLMLRLPGEEHDPLDRQEEELDWGARLMADLGMAPVYKYSKGINQVSVKLKKLKKNNYVNILAAAATALLLGALGVLLFPEPAVRVNELIIHPMREMILELITATAGPLVFLAVLLGVCGMDNLDDFGKLGKSTICRYVLALSLFTGVAGALFLPFFSLNFDKVGFSAEQLSMTINMMTEIMPDNMVEPFVSGNTLQIVVVALLVGLAMLALGDRAEGLKALAAEANSVMGVLVSWAGKLLPVLIFLVLLENLWAGSLAELAAIIKPAIIVCAIAVIVSLSVLVAAALTMRIPFAFLVKNVLPLGLLGLATSSSVACLGRMMENSENNLGMHKKIINFAMPIGTILLKVGTASYLFILALFCAEHFAVPCSPAWILMAFLTSVLLSIAIPPVVGGNLIGYAALFAQMGLPEEAMVFAIGMDLMLDRFVTFVNMVFQQIMHLYNADRLGLRDKELLSRENLKAG